MDQDCYSSMYKWFEQCGVISNIRAHLRQNLINALKNKDLTIQSNSPKSAKQYVYDFLIAEYLFNHNYAYTLSVFASEAPMLINFSKTVQQPEGNEKDNSKEKLQSDYVIHALETLGINPRDAKGQYVISEYIKNDMPLLLCILKCITMFSYNMRNSVSIKEKLSLCNESTQTEYSWQSYNCQSEKLNSLKKKISVHKQVVDNKLRKREIMLKQQAVLVDQQIEVLNAKLQEVQDVMCSISLKEKQLKEKEQNNEQQILQKEIQLTLREKLLLQETNRLQKEQDECRKLEHNLKKLQEHKKVQEAQLDVPVKFNLRDTQMQTDFSNIVAQEDKIKVLTREKEELTGLIRDQQLRIDQITQRALQLSRQVEEIRSLRPTSIDIPPQTQFLANTVVSESSSTEDILQDAKLRLKRLEEESLKADQYYYNFINNSS